MKQSRLQLIIFIFILQLLPILFAQTPYTNQNNQFDWHKRSDFKGGKIESAVAFTIGQKGYVCIGTDGNKVKKDCWQYDTKEDKWNKMSDFLGEPRMSAVAFTIKDRAYVGTGFAGSEARQSGTKDLWEYNPLTDSWTQKADLPGEERYGAIGFSIADKGYIGLGATTGNLKYNNDFWEYNPQKNLWTKKANFPEKGRMDASVFVIESNAYVLLGQESMELTASKKNVWKYNPKKNVWEKRADFPGSPRLGATAFSLNNKGYIYAGYNGVSSRYQDFWEYDAASNSWEQNTDAPAGTRSSAFCFVIDSTAYIGTGYQKQLSGKNDVWSVSEKIEKINVDYNAKLLYQDKNQKLPLSQQGVSLISEEKKVIQTTTTDNNGAFAFKKIDKEKIYQVVLNKNDKLPAYATVAIAKPNGKIIQNMEKNASGQFAYEISKLDFLEEDDSYFNLQFFMKSSDKEITITKYIYYLPNSWELAEEAQDILYEVIVSLNQYANLFVDIASLTDSRGDDAANMHLSEKRAQAVVDYIISNGIDTKRISGKGYGETKIINKCKNGVDCSEEEHKENRRTEFKFIKHE